MKTTAILSGVFLLACATLASNFRINHAGRILGTVPTVTSPILFNTPQADAVMAAMQAFPPTNAWNEDISRRLVLSNSLAMTNTVAGGLSTSRQGLRLFPEMNYVLVPDNQPFVPIDFVQYGDQSDPSPYPIADTTPIEAWPIDVSGETLTQVQHDTLGLGGDRHAIIVQPSTGLSWETWQMLRHSDNTWEASNGAKFNLNSNNLRPDTWTSGDAAGFPMFPAVIRYDECERGMVEHAMRLAVPFSRNAHIYPATHDAGSTDDPNTPAMGQRFRLKASFVIPATWTKEEKAVALALKKYGCMVSDNSGGFISMSYCPDQRFPEGCFDDLQSVTMSDFDVIQTTGPAEGPRSPKPPIVNTGSDQTVPINSAANLPGVVSGGAGPLTISWTKYSGPGTVNFANPSQAATTATFSVPGAYILMLKADDQIHTPAYNAINVTVTNATAPHVTAFNIYPTSFVGGNSPTGTVILSGPAPAGGVTVSFASANSAQVAAPASIVVPTGASSKTLPVPTAGASVSTSVKITATGGGSSASSTITVLPASLYAHSMVVGSVTSGHSATAQVSLNGKAPAGGASVALHSSAPSVASVVSSVTVPAQTSALDYSITTAGVASPSSAVISASLGGVTKTATVTVNPAVVSLLHLLSTTTVGGSYVEGIVSLNGDAAPGGTVVTLSSNSAYLQVPASVTVAAQGTAAAFYAATSGVPSTTAVTITSSFGGVSKQATVSLSPASLVSVSVTPNPTAGAKVVTITVALNGKPYNGGSVALTSSDPTNAHVPTTVTVPANLFKASINVALGSFKAGDTVTFTATYHGVVKSVVLTIS
jgi:hypothetical protein